MEHRLQERFVKAGLGLFLIVGAGCSANTVSSVEEINGVKIVKTTDRGDDVVEDARGNQYTFTVENDDLISFYVRDYKTESTDLFPVKNEIDGNLSDQLDENGEATGSILTVSLSSSTAEDTDGTDSAFFLELVYYSVEDETVSFYTENLEDRVDENIDPEVRNFLETDEVIPLCKELNEVVQAYRQLKND